MGTFDAPAGKTPGKFTASFLETLNPILNQFPGYQKAKLETLFTVVEFNYDQFIREKLKQIADQANSLKTGLALIGGLPANSITEITDALTKFDAGLTQDKFVYTHVLDVLLYGTDLGAYIRAEAGRFIASVFANPEVGEVHIIAHSLGTAVVHDSLQQLYANSSPFHLSPQLHKLSSLWMIANVSLLYTNISRLTSPFDGVVKPGTGGCVIDFYNVHHRLDPFTLVKPFAPANSGTWIPTNTYTSFFHDLETEAVFTLNTHAFENYLQDPKTYLPLFFELIEPFDPTPAEANQVITWSQQKTLQSSLAQLQQDIAQLKVTPPSLANWAELAKAVAQLAKLIKQA